MAVSWIKTNCPGVRYREHAKRKHGIRADRCFSIRYKVDGQDKEEVVGWSSEGMTMEKAFKIRGTIRENIRLGTGPRSIADMRQEYERLHKEAIQAQQEHEKVTMTVSDFWNNTYFPAAETTKKPRTMASEKGYFFNWIEPSLGGVPLQEISSAEIEKLIQKLSQAGKSPATVRYVLAIISQMWNKAVSYGLIQGECPVHRVKKPRQDNRRTRFLSKEEARNLLKALAKKSMVTHDIALLSLLSGMRAGEIFALTWADVDFENGTILIRDPKNKRNRHAFLTNETRAMLEGRYAGQPKNVLIFAMKTGEQKQWISPTFMRIVDELGMNNSGEVTTDSKGNKVPIKIKDARARVVFHSLRHTFASRLVQNGTALYTVAQLMGHSTLEMTMRYAHLAPDTLRQAIQTLEGSLDEVP